MSEDVFDFPCRFPIKIMGREEPGFTAHVLNLIAPHVDDIDADDIKMRASKQGQYVSITVTINAVSREQLDLVYTRLTSSERILFVL